MRMLSICAVLVVPAVALAAEVEQRQGVERAEAFWSAVAAADTDAMRKHYADKVLLKAGSELLKRQWGLPGGGDRGKDLLVERDALVAGYGRMIESIGKDRWRGIFTKIDPEKISFRFAKSADGKLGLRPGDLTMTVATGAGDDRLLFVLRHDAQHGWQVVVEATDY